KTTGGFDADLLLATRAFITRRDVDDAIGVNVKGHFDLRNAARSRGNAIENKASQRAVVLGKLALPLQHIDLYTWLVVAGRGEDLALLGGDGGVALDQARGDATECLDAQR